MQAGDGGVGRTMVGCAESYTGVTMPAAYTVLDTNSDNVTVITSQPTTQTNFLGANVIFSVGVYGLPTLMFQWNFNGARIPGATSQVLSLSNIALTNTGNYSVTVSNAVMTLVSSSAFLKVLDTAIPFGDGIPNWWKTQYGLSLTDPTLANNHPAGDRLTYLQKYLYGLNPLTTDTDGDGISDYDEVFVYRSNPLSANTAGDGIPDGWKAQHGLNPLVSDANNDAGFDGVSYLQVYQYNLAHPTTQLDPNRPFTVGTGLSNYEIINNGQHTNRFYYDHEDRLLGMETSRGISIAYQYDGNGNLTRQTVLSRAGETNGLPLLWCFLNGLTNNPNPYADNDGDGWSNYQEWMAGTNPNDTNSRPTMSSAIETAPYAVVLPSTNALGGLAVVTVRLWDNEGNSSTPFLQYQILGSTNWQDAAVYGLDGGPYSSTNRVAALPGGVNHAVKWNVMADLGPAVVTNVLLRVRAQDFMMVGDWSVPTPFQVNMTQDSNGNGIPDWWEYYYFGSLQPGNGDYDGDGVSNYAEYIADTDPTDPNSYLQITSAQVSTNGVQINWSGGSQAWQYLQRISSVGGTNTWVNIQTVQPPTAVNGSYTDAPTTNKASFYRIRVQRP
jgi:YD repeat-containing protein